MPVSNISLGHIDYPNFPVPQGQQVAPDILGALSKGVNIRDAIVQSRLHQIQSQYAPQMAEQELQKAALSNQFYPKLMESKLALQKAQAKRQEQLANLPGGGYNFTGPAGQALSLEVIKQTYGEDSPVYQNSKKMFDANLKKAGLYGAGVGGQQLSRLSEQIRLDNPNLTPDQINAATNAYIEGKRVLPDGTKLPDPSGQSRTLLDEIEVKRRGMKNITQQVRANTLDSIMDEADKHAQGAFTYSGLLGKGNLSVDQVKSALQQQNPQSYADYIQFTRTDVPTMMGEMLLTLGGNATDNQKAIMAQIANPIMWDVSPDIALQSWQYVKHLFRDVISPSITLSPTEIKEKIKAKQNLAYEKILLKDMKTSNINQMNNQQIDDIANRKLSYER